LLPPVCHGSALSNTENQIEQLEAAANESELIASLSTFQDVKTRNMELARRLRDQAAALRGGRGDFPTAIGGHLLNGSGGKAPTA
jgi:hypothetical protein